MVPPHILLVQLSSEVLSGFLRKEEWPSNSPDLNPIENCWGILNSWVFHIPPPTIINQLNARAVEDQSLMVHFLLLPKTQEDRPMEKFILLFVSFVAFTGLTNGAGLLPDTMTAAEGGTVMFTTVSPPAGPFALINWLFGNKPIIIATPDPGTPFPGYEGRVTIFPDTGSLELRNLSLSDSGEYTVRILTSADHAGTTTLEVVGAAGLQTSERWLELQCEVVHTKRISNPSITPTNVAIEGNNLNLICDAAGSMLTRKWLKDGSDLTLSDNITLDDDNRVLSFQPLNRADRGIYSCNITNPISTMEAEHTLVVNYGPDKAQIKGESKINSG
ncbi:HEPACAM family member 2-like [Cheilinus undulatus]|uniref:HEPACAM family member 2-like n=1 Tax=Cheilinus undulatus TaxID=241271 RepID=UPI001BD3E981|nr:HEPACAM family member 2-like [Cheilinus undulatus]